ncbi:methyltransferase domain-containing protein [Fibrobacterota bacterium]
MKIADLNECRICSSSNFEVLLNWEKFPIYIWPIGKKLDPEFERLKVYYCSNCGLVQLDSFEEGFINKLYVNDSFGLIKTKEFPTTEKKNNDFLNYCYSLMGESCFKKKRILDIGGYDFLCNFDIDFLEGVICDPNAPYQTKRANISVVKEFFSRSKFNEEQFDFIIAKHIIEHINDLKTFMNDVRYILKEGGKAIIEIPELMYALSNINYTFFYHQHLSYFEECSITNLLQLYGFDIVDLQNDKGVIRLIAERQKRIEFPGFEKNEHLLLEFRRYEKELDAYLRNLERFFTEAVADEQCIFYGAGSSTVLLLNLNKKIKKYIKSVVDSSENKIGKKISGTDIIVEAPATIKKDECQNIVICSDEFFEEIVEKVKSYKTDFNYLKIYPNFSKVHYTKENA